MEITGWNAIKKCFLFFFFLSLSFFVSLDYYYYFLSPLPSELLAFGLQGVQELHWSLWGWVPRQVRPHIE